MLLSIGSWYTVPCPRCGALAMFPHYKHDNRFVTCATCALAIDLCFPAAVREPEEVRTILNAQFVEVQRNYGGLALPLVAGEGVALTDAPEAQVQIDSLIEADRRNQAFDRRLEHDCHSHSHGGHRHGHNGGHGHAGGGKSSLLCRPLRALGDRAFVLLFGPQVGSAGQCAVHAASWWRPHVVLSPQASLCAVVAALVFFPFFAVSYLATEAPGPLPEWLWPCIHRTGLCCVVSFSMIVATTFVDPGYLQPNLDPPPPLPGAALKLFTGDADDEDDECAGRNSTVEVRGVTVERRWCKFCHLLRPARASHCHVCQLCVEEQSHHCGVLGVCVGRRNTRTFIGFLVATSVALEHGSVIYVALGTSLGGLFHAFVYAMAGLIIVPAVIVVHGMAFGALMNVALGTTQRERLHRVWGRGSNPFDEGCVRNFLRVFCAPRGPATVSVHQVELASIDAPSRDA